MKRPRPPNNSGRGGKKNNAGETLLRKGCFHIQNLGRITNGKDVTTKDYVDTAVSGRQAQIVTGTLTLTATWSGSGPYTQTVTVPGGTANSKVDIQPDATALTRLISDGVTALWIENDGGVFTAKALGAAPTAAMTVQITVTEV